MSPPPVEMWVVYSGHGGFTLFPQGFNAAGFSPILGGRARVKPEDAAGVTTALNATAAAPAPKWAVDLLEWYRRKWASDRIKKNMKAKKTR